MKVPVTLYGTLTEKHPTFCNPEGIEVDLSSGSTVKDLLKYFNILKPAGVMVIQQERVLSSEEILTAGKLVNILQVVSGG